jgi:glucosamine 6-phosphate synthetase-like amidotransferase/phosphosugar isomerase protein
VPPPDQVKARGAELIIITDKAELARDLDDSPIVIPPNGAMTALSALMPLQLIAYELALLRCVILENFLSFPLTRSVLTFVSFFSGHNPDTPRNLAKYYH